MEKDSGKQNFFSGKTNRNFPAFITCLFIACAIWVLNALSKSYNATYHFQVISTSTVNRVDPIDVNVILSGDGFDLFHWNLFKPHQYVLSHEEILNGTPLTSKVIASRVLHDYTGKINVISAEPMLVSFNSNKLARKKIPVTVKANFFYKAPAEPTGRVFVRPDSIEISGTGSELEKIDGVNTEEIVFKNIREPFFHSISLSQPKDNVFYSHSKVWLYIPVEDYTEGEVMIPVLFSNDQIRAKLLPSKVKVIYKAPLSRFAAINPRQFILKAIPDNTEETGMARIAISRKPPFVRGIRTEPSRVEYYLNK